MTELKDLWVKALHPVSGFKASSHQAPDLAVALRRMLCLRVPLAFLDATLMYRSTRALLLSLKNLDGQSGGLIRQYLPPELTLEELRNVLKSIPDPPPLVSLLPWLAVLAFAGILGAWLHHAVWDHTCLWMLRGLKHRRSFRVSLVAEAEALSVGVFGALLGLLGNLPRVGCLFGILSALTGIWFWCLRGVALAVFHECPAWKGITATLLHALLLVLFAFGLLAAMSFFVMVLLGPS